VLQITWPLIAAIFGASWLQSKRLDDIVVRLSAREQEVRAIRRNVLIKEKGSRAGGAHPAVGPSLASVLSQKYIE
jgi:hypothetical protein